MLELLFVRHGQTDWNAKRLVMGRRPIPLNDVGRKQAEGLSNFLKKGKLSAVISSPVLRAMETAKAVAAPHKLKVIEDAGLAEVDYGDWVGKDFDDLACNDAELWREYHLNPENVSLPNGEAMPDVIKRISVFMEKVLDTYDNGRIAIVSHADVLKLAVAGLLDLQMNAIKGMSIDNCAMILIRMQKEVGPRLIFYNYDNGFGLDM